MENSDFSSKKQKWKKFHFQPKRYFSGEFFFPKSDHFFTKINCSVKSKTFIQKQFWQKIFDPLYLQSAGGAINKQTKTTLTLISYMPDKINYSFTLPWSLLNLICVGWFKKNKGYLWFVFCSYETGSPFYLLFVYSSDWHLEFNLIWKKYTYICFLHMEKLNKCADLSCDIFLLLMEWWVSWGAGWDLRLRPTPCVWLHNSVPTRGYPCRHWHQMHSLWQIVMKYTTGWKYLESPAVWKELG